MSEWTEGILKDLVQINPTVKLIKGEFYPFISMDVLRPNYKPVESQETREFKTGGSKFGDGDTLFARITPCLENGKIAQVKNLKRANGFGSTEFIVMRGKDGVTDNEFVYYLVTNQTFRENAERLMVGTSGRQRVDKEQFENQIIKIPNIEYQKRISSILRSLDDKIHLNRQMNETLEEMAMTLYKHWFVDFGPFQDGEFIDSELGMIPKGWTVGTLKDFGIIKTGKTPPTKDTTNFGDDYLFITPTDIANEQYIVKTNRSLSHKGSLKLKNYLIPQNSIGVTCIGSDMGKVFLTSEESYTNQQINCLIPYKTYLSQYVYLFLNSNREFLRHQAGGSTMPILNKTSFSDIEVIRPDEEILRTFSDLTVNFYNKILLNIKNSMYLEETRSYLLPRLLSGEIEVGEAEEQIEEVLSND